MSTKSGANALHGSATGAVLSMRAGTRLRFHQAGAVSADRCSPCGGKYRWGNELATSRWCLRDTPTSSRDHQRPVYIPKVFDGRNKLFFFLGYSGLQEPAIGAVERDQLHGADGAYAGGDFSKMLLINPNGRYIVYDPLPWIPTGPRRSLGAHAVHRKYGSERAFKNPITNFYASACRSRTHPTIRPGADQQLQRVEHAQQRVQRLVQQPHRYQASANHRFYVRWVSSNYLEDAQDTPSHETGLMEWTRSATPQRRGRLDLRDQPDHDAERVAQREPVLAAEPAPGHAQVQADRRRLPAYMDAKCCGSCVLPRVVWPGMTAWSGDMVLGVAVDAWSDRTAAELTVQSLARSQQHSFRAGIDFRQHYRTLLQNGGLTSAISLWQ
jgi:hypothetical protein